MGKYMKKGKITGDVAVMEVPQSALGVRTRAKTLALQQSPELSYLQLRSRRLEKPQFPPPSPTKTERMEKQKHCNRGVGHTQSERAGSRLRVCSGNSVPACSASLSRSKKVELEEEEAEAEKCAGKLGSRSSTPIQRAKGGAIGTKFDDFGVEASFGENNLEFDGIGRQLNHFGDVGSLDDNVESFLTHDGGNGRDLYGTTEQKREPSTGFTFAEVGCIRTRNKVTSCHFSSDGKFLASAGHDRKVVLWSMDTIGTENTPEEHKHVITDVRLRPNSTQLATASFDGSVRLWDAANVVLWNMDTIGTENTPEERKHVITDVRFRPNSTQLATASFDGSVRLWDAANPNHCLNVYSGHSSHITSLDFHPRKNDLFCFCDSNNEIRYWKINPFSCAHISRGGTVHVRFQPRVGQLLAAVSEQAVNFFDVDNDRIVQTFQAHSGVAVDYICWDASGKLLACVSPDSVKVWSITSGDCVHELISSNGNQFHSCVFHPSYCELLVIGGTQSIELWNMADNRSMTVPAHENIISALATSVSGMVASAGLDCSVKLWK